ncbi:MAG: GTPase SAR1 family protein [Candidatus Aldehydirespiratoraceae bacterium]|jgi:GTPase SAR1 family protein
MSGMGQPAPGSLLEAVNRLLNDAIRAFSGTAQEQQLRSVLARAGEPLRVAIAGKVKAGKSTLLNALVGEELAPTDEGECTRIVTWYQNSHTYKVEVEPLMGAARQVPFVRNEGAIEVDLGDLDPSEITRLVVDWPSRSLERITLIDTPGIASLSAEVSARSYAFLAPDDDHVTEADAVLYLMKHLHASDVGFLESFHDEAVSQATPVNAIAILSRADELGCGRLDSMVSAQRIAGRYRTDPNIRRLAQTVLPVAALLAATGSTLREVEFSALSRLAEMPETEAQSLLISVDRFVNSKTSSDLAPEERSALLERLGLFGVRFSMNLISEGQVETSSQLSQALIGASGLRELQAALLTQFAERRDVLKARSGMLAIEAAMRALPDVDTGTLSDDVERVTAGAHEFNELRLLNALRTGAVLAKQVDVEEMERLLGTSGMGYADRLGVDRGANPGAIGEAAQGALLKWQRKAESPMSAPSLAAAARVMVRTCEGILTSLAR